MDWESIHKEPMPTPIALQLYSVREQLAQDFTGTLRRIADMGFVGVETAGMYGGSPATAAKLFADLGLSVSSAHGPLPLGDKKQEVLDTLAALNCRRLVLAWQPPELFKSVDSIKRVCESINEANVIARANGLSLGYHNHWFEYEPLNGRPAMEVMLDYLDPTVFLEVDVYWVQTAGHDPAKVVKQLGQRAPLLHIKDGPCQIQPPMTALGEGVVDIPAILSAASAEWLVVELDRCATDMLEAVQKSYRYLSDISR